VRVFALGVAIGILLAAVRPAGAPDVQGRAAATVALQSSVVLTQLERGARGRGFCGGTIVGADLVLTAFHCVRTTIGESSNKPLGVREYLNKGVVVAARVVWHRNGVDLALLRTESPLLGRPAQIVSDLAVGEPVIVVGSPSVLEFSNEFMLTRGTVGKIEVRMWMNCDGSREPFGSDEHQVVYIDAHVYYGNSGGGAFNDAGQLMGVLVRGETAEPDTYVACAGEVLYMGEDLLWAYLVGPEELRKVPKP